MILDEVLLSLLDASIINTSINISQLGIKLNFDYKIKYTVFKRQLYY